MVTVTHFGETIGAEAPDREMTREGFARPRRRIEQTIRSESVSASLWNELSWMFEDEKRTALSDEYILRQRSAALVNFDLSMRYFSTLSRDEFDSALARCLKAGGFQQVSDISSFRGIRAAYVLVFDSYCQFYVGQALDVAAAVVRHWLEPARFDRLLAGSEYESVFPVDEFGPLDNTRIFISRAPDRHAVQRAGIAASNRSYCLNRTPGGTLGGTELRDLPGGPHAARLWRRAPLIGQGQAHELRARAARIVLDETQDLHGLTRLPSGFAGGVYRCAAPGGRISPWSPISTVAGLGGASIERRLRALSVLGQDIALPD